MDTKTTNQLTKTTGLALAIKECLIKQAKVDGSVTVESVINEQWRCRDRDLAGDPEYDIKITEEMQLFWEARKMLDIEPYLEKPVSEYITSLGKNNSGNYLN